MTDPPAGVPAGRRAPSAVLGLMVSMYTVWAGAVYAVVWIVMLGAEPRPDRRDPGHGRGAGNRAGRAGAAAAGDRAGPRPPAGCGSAAGGQLRVRGADRRVMATEGTSYEPPDDHRHCCRCWPSVALGARAGGGRATSAPGGSRTRWSTRRIAKWRSWPGSGFTFADFRYYGPTSASRARRCRSCWPGCSRPTGAVTRRFGEQEHRPGRPTGRPVGVLRP